MAPTVFWIGGGGDGNGGGGDGGDGAGGAGGDCHSAAIRGAGGGCSQLWRHEAHRTWRPDGPTALSGTT
jgi:hypothetical protein